MPWDSARILFNFLFSKSLLGRALLLGLFFFLAFGAFSAVNACTLWGAAGAAVEGNGAIVVKNRDWKPDHRQELRVLRPKNGYASIVLMAVGGDEPGVKAGVNEKGLAIVSATAGQLTRDERNRVLQKPGLIKSLLAECATVGDVLKRLDRFQRPVYYLVGDRSTVATIEVAPDGRVHVERRSGGALTHTNHYRSADVQGVERLPSASSASRLDRIEHLLKERHHPFSLADFILFSEDKSAGPDNSIFRTGSVPGKMRTLATWIARIPAAGSPELHIRILDPGRQARICAFPLDRALAADRSLTALDNVLCTRATDQE